MCQYDEAQNFFHYLKDDHSATEDLPWIEQSLGHILSSKCQWNEAKVYLDQSYHRMISHEPLQIKDSTVVLQSLGQVLERQGKVEESYELHEKALLIRKQFYSFDYPRIADSLECFGLVGEMKKNDGQVLHVMEQALAIREKYYGHFHADIGQSLNKMNELLLERGEHDKALSNQNRAMSIYKESYPCAHVTIVDTLICMSRVFHYQAKYEKCLNLLLKTSMTIRRLFEAGHYKFSLILCNIGHIRHRQSIFNECLEFYCDTFMRAEKFLSSKHLDITLHLRNILEKFYPSYILLITDVVYCIGNTLSEQGKLDDYYINGSVQVSPVLISVAGILIKQKKT
ncbi:unnamed protein product [Adineta ricciae]|uniref:Uncharacterized protein n=1 Tax=Adineta ricciae TaxID=249248 RepID=A0A814R8U3_ADIRI|nr:unnamed protein product [Adineta ricciae]CAF1413543.1 unnamed protein product [Adineta ricciae]